MKNYILYNPLAGNGAHEDQLNALKESCKGEVECLAVTDVDDMSAFCATLSADDTVILCGGDGTLNRFINDTEGVSIPCDILYCAMGSGNDFLHDLNKAPDAEPFSVKQYISDLPTVTVKGKTYRFLNNVGFGIDGYCCEVGDRLKVEKPGEAVNYTSIAINGLLFHYKPTNAVITVDGTEYRYKKVWLAPTMKGRYYGGGMMATPEQDRTDPEGTLSVMLFYGKGRLLTLMAFPSIFKGEHVKKKNMVAVHSGKTIRVQFDSPAAVQIDGETILGVTEYTATAKVPSPVTV
jgi:diacylglycerol kinase family enzyme